MKLFKYLQYIFLLSVLGISIVILYLWNIQQDLPDHNISQYFPNEITKIYDEKYDLLYHVGARDRFYLNYEDIPQEMINAIISAEDKTFFEHQGFDIKGIANAFFVNIRNIYSKKNNNYVGASTITQQLVKNILLNNDQTISRKIKELILSIRVENSYSKEFILELYLNEIYFGRRSYGIASAANNYFNKSIFDLDIHEYAYLAALPKGPNNYDPKKNYERAFDRRNYVLRQMNENRFISDDAYKIAIKEKIIVSERNNKKYQLDYKTDFILNSLNNSTKDANNAFYIQSTINQNIIHALGKMYKPCLFAALTTIFAFGSLYTSGIKPVMDFGLMMCMGLTITYVSSFIFLPILISVLNLKSTTLLVKNNSKDVFSILSIKFPVLTLSIFSLVNQ